MASYISTTEKGFKQYFALPYLAVGVTLAVVGSILVKLVGGVLTPKAK